jgi:hypothetical protein
LIDSSWFYTPENITTGSFVEPVQYTSKHNDNANYEVTLEVPNTDICFGYILETDSDAGIA